MSAELIHATAVALDGRAVLLTGPSGAGKSDLALRLVDRGWVLVGDDYVELFEGDGGLRVRPCPTIAGRIEVRGIGIVDMPYLVDAAVALAVELGADAERLPEPKPAFRSVPRIALAPFETSAPIKLELALTRLGLGLEAAPR